MPVRTNKEASSTELTHSALTGKLNTRNLYSHLFYGPYVWFPILALVVWLGGISTMLFLWISEGKPRYRGDEADVVFISDVGAVHKTLFISVSGATSGLYIMTLVSERWLRHVGRLPVDTRQRELVFDWLAILFCVIGSAGLILCAIFDTVKYPKFHWPMALTFVGGVSLSAFFQSAEIWSLHKNHPDRRSLLRSTICKLIVVFISLIGVAGFGSTYIMCGGDVDPTSIYTAEECNQISSLCATLEWSIAFMLSLYFATLIGDLWPAGKSSPRYMKRLARWQEKHGEGHDFTGRKAFKRHPERWMTLEQRVEEMQAATKERNMGSRMADG